MAVDVLLIREGKGLFAVDAISSDSLAEMKQGEIVTATIKRPRNLQHHRKFFALLKIVFTNQTRYATTHQLLDAIKISIGYYETYLLPGKIPVTVCKPKSISFASMDQGAFREFWDKAVEFIVTDILPGVDSEDLEREVLEMLI